MENPYEPPRSAHSPHSIAIRFHIRQGSLVYLAASTIVGAIGSLILCDVLVNMRAGSPRVELHENPWLMHALGAGGLLGAVLYKIGVVALSPPRDPIAGDEP